VTTAGSNEIGAALCDSLCGSVLLPFNDAERKFQATNKNAASTSAIAVFAMALRSLPIDASILSALRHASIAF
jgi:hypothetical protein